MSNFPKEYNFACTLTFSDFTSFVHVSLFQKSSSVCTCNYWGFSCLKIMVILFLQLLARVHKPGAGASDTFKPQ